MAIELMAKARLAKAVIYTGDNAAALQVLALEAYSYSDDIGIPVIESYEGPVACEPGMALLQDEQGLHVYSPEHLAARYDADPDLIASMEKHWNKAEREAAPASDWALPEKKKLRIDNTAHVRLAWDMVDRVKDLSEAERAKARRRILAKAKKLGIDTGDWEKKGISMEDIDAEVVVLDQESPTVPGPSDGIAYLMDHAAEEAGELIQALVHAIRFGLDNPDPKRQGKTPREQISRELNDVLGVVAILNEELASRGVTPIAFGEGRGLEASIADRMASLQSEYEAGRYVLPVVGGE